MKKLLSINDLATFKDKLRAQQRPDKKVVYLCGGTGCNAFGGQEVKAAFEKAVKDGQLSDKVDIKPTGCHGFCQQGPIVVIGPEEIFYPKVKVEHVPDIIEKTILNNEIIEDLLYVDPVSRKKNAHVYEIAFYAHQKPRIVLKHNGRIDPTRIDDYIVKDGYAGLAKALSSMSCQDVIDTIKTSGLRGRGGAGFPTGLKWDFCRKSPGDVKYIICNGDEGDPGAFMDRSVLEGDPHAVLEGMIIGAYAMGATKGYIYVRAEYPLALNNLEIAIAQAREYGLLGENILGCGFSFDLAIKVGAGAFVCGEETALIASIEGKRGMPRQRPPFPAQSGLWGKPTNINNVETLANIATIILKGGQWYAGLGTEKSKGTKVFALTGKVKNNGLIEVPMGITLREIVNEIGGGIPNRKKFKAAQLGGPSGGCVPAELMDTPIDYDSLNQAGAIMGSGGVVIMDSSTCMVDMARYFLQFTQNESCGKCVPCRVGTKRMLEILNRISEGEGREEDIDLLIEMSNNIKSASLCGLGQTAPNPVLSTIRYYRHEYETHIRQKICPVGQCQAITRFEVNADLCKACSLCVKACPVDAISGGSKKVPAEIVKEKCIKCRNCVDACPFSAIY